jgi:hypothetical protein
VDGFGVQQLAFSSEWPLTLRIGPRLGRSAILEPVTWVMRYNGKGAPVESGLRRRQIENLGLRYSVPFVVARKKYNVNGNATSTVTSDRASIEEGARRRAGDGSEGRFFDDGRSLFLKRLTFKLQTLKGELPSVWTNAMPASFQHRPRVPRRRPRSTIPRDRTAGRWQNRQTSAVSNGCSQQGREGASLEVGSQSVGDGLERIVAAEAQRAAYVHPHGLHDGPAGRACTVGGRWPHRTRRIAAPQPKRPTRPNVSPCCACRGSTRVRAPAPRAKSQKSRRVLQTGRLLS